MDVQHGGRNVDAARDLALLTPFPCLTGAPPNASKGFTVVESASCKITLSDVQDAASRHHASIDTLIQAIWAKLLVAYSGINDGITFLTYLPTPNDRNFPQAPQLKTCHFNLNPHGPKTPELLLGDDGQTKNETNALSDDHEGYEGQVANSNHGTLLDLRTIFEPCDECDISKEDAGTSTGSSVAVHLQIYSASNRTLWLELSASNSVLNDDAAQLVLTHFSRTLEVRVKKPNILLDDVFALLAPSLLSASNPEPASPAHVATLQYRFEKIAETSPQHIALEFVHDLGASSPLSVTIWTYGELNQRADALASHLQSRFGSLVDCVMPICMDRCPDIYVSVLGILKAGGAWCPIDPSFPPRRRHDLIYRAGAKALIVNDQSPQDGIPANMEVVNVAKIEKFSTAKPKLPRLIPESLAYLIWTSGTTGAPKGVPIHHKAAVASMEALQKCIPVDCKGGSVRCLQFSQFTFDVFVQDLFYTWGVVGTLISADRTTILGSFAEVATKTNATHAHLTPAFADSVARQQCPTLEVVTMIGEKLTTKVSNDWSQDCRLYNTYGPAETTVVSTLRLVPHEDPLQSANIGYPLPSVSAFVIVNGRITLKGGIGELALGGPQLSQGYWNDSERTRERFVWNAQLKTTLYMTGDGV